jgi:hypothetical protein
MVAQLHSVSSANIHRCKNITVTRLGPGHDHVSIASQGSALSSLSPTFEISSRGVLLLRHEAIPLVSVVQLNHALGVYEL